MKQGYITVFGECIQGSFLILVSVYTWCPFGGTRNIYPTSYNLNLDLPEHSFCLGLDA